MGCALRCARHKSASSGGGCDQGYAEAQTSLGFFHSHGSGRLPKDEREAARLYKLAADQGHARAQYILGILYKYGRGGLAKDEHEANRLFTLAAEQGNENAKAALAGRALDRQGDGFGNSGLYDSTLSIILSAHNTETLFSGDAS